MRSSFKTTNDSPFEGPIELPTKKRRKTEKKEPDRTQSTLLDYALAYIGRGWKILPVHSITAGGKCTCNNRECPTKGKHPRISNWQKDATIDETQIRQWWSLWPDANIGILTGVDSGLWALDVDPRNGGNESLSDLINEIGELPKTMRVSTGGDGTHYYFSWPKKKTKFKGKIKKGIDIKSTGGYIIAPPSNHHSGGKYEWIK